jgi:hypothetical protein
MMCLRHYVAWQDVSIRTFKNGARRRMNRRRTNSLRFFLRHCCFGIFIAVVFAESTAGAHHRAGRELVYDIDFRKTGRLESPWTFRAPGTERGYLNHPSAVTVTRDIGLEIKTDFSVNPTLSGMVSTQRALYVQGGLIETSVHLPRLKGHHCALWLKSDQYDAVGSSKDVGVELDVFEFHNNAPKNFFGTVHAYGYGAAHVLRQRTFALPPHNEATPIRFAVDWRPDGYTFYVNDIPMGNIREMETWVPMYLILSCHPSRWGGTPPTTGPRVDVFRVESVKVFQDSSIGEKLFNR